MTAPGSKKEDQASFAGWKLDWSTAIRMDGRLNSTEKIVAETLLEFLNSETRQCNPSTPLVAQLLGCGLRTVEDCRKRLQETGWLDWHRTRRTNRYRFLDDNVAPMLARRESILEARRQERKQVQSHPAEPDITDWTDGDEAAFAETYAAKTRNILRVETRKILRNGTRNNLRVNTLREHPEGTPEEGMTGLKARHPSHIEAVDSSVSNGKNKRARAK